MNLNIYPGITRDFFSLFKKKIVIKFNHEKSVDPNELKIQKSKLEKKLISSNVSLLKICPRDRFHDRGSLPLLALLAYSKASKIEFSSICFF